MSNNFDATAADIKPSLSQAVLKHVELVVTKDIQHETVVETNVAHNEKGSNKVHLKQKTIDLTKNKIYFNRNKR